MRLKGGYTEILIEEELTATYAREISAGWRASLDGVEADTDATVRMTRRGNSADDALKNLFEGMHEEGITL